MNPPIASPEAETAYSGVDTLPVDPAELHMATIADEKLIADVAKHRTRRVRSRETGMDFVNRELAELIKANYTDEELADIDRFMAEKGTSEIPILRGYTVMVDGVERSIAMVAATETGADGANHGDMSSMLYLRDQVQTASAMMELSLQNPDEYAAKGGTGKELLLSALHLMSTPAQLERFENVIQLGPQAGQEDWPHISLWFDDLDGVNPNKWRNKQDSFQMLAHLTLDAIDRGFLKPEELAEGHKKFLASIVPMLESVGFPCYESSGSWEEITAVRTSVMAVETAMLYKMKTLVEKDPAMDFLADGYSGDFSQVLDKMVGRGLHELGQRLPDESPDYDPESIEYRQADAALTYVLMYDLPQLLADYKIPMAASENKPMVAEEIEHEVLKQLKRLIDPETHGMNRYETDSYQRVNFHTNFWQTIIRGIKRKVLKDAMRGGGEIDLVEKQRLRDELMPDGRLAAWTHPVAQIASWAAKRSITVQDQDPVRAGQYRELSTYFLNATLSNVTGENQWHVAQDADGKYQVIPVPANKLPECWLTFITPAGEEIIDASSHTPLNWATAEAAKTVGLLRTATQRATKNRS